MHLQSWLEQACGGRRQMVFIPGEAGIGKTTVVDTFVAGIAAMEGVGIAYGQCVEHYGAGEAYQPVLEALEEALAIVRDTQERVYEAELYRCKGHLLLSQAVPNELDE